ncbi:MAG: hypothetical protein ACQBVK_01600, partial [Candidatus Phytoplasma sp. TWB_XP]
MRQALRRFPVSQPSQQRARSYTFPAPTRGLILNENLASAGGAGAGVLDNYFPTQTSIRIRGGSRRVATIGTMPVVSLITYSTALKKAIFAASE